jgi:ribonuclease BN (tRNA processing enzyme)
MKIQAIGRGGAFAPVDIGNSNFILTSDTGKKMIIDWGITAPFIYRDEMGLDYGDIDAVWISHLHADHVGGMELLAFHRHFMPKRNNEGVRIKPKLFMVKPLMMEMWENTLRGGLESLEGEIVSLTKYFHCVPVEENTRFKWEGLSFTPVQTVHVRSGFIIKHSYGLYIAKPQKMVGAQDSIYLTSDTQFDRGLMPFYRDAKLILQDCETGDFKSNVHAHYSDLKTLPDDVRAKMWLYHYNKPEPTFKEDGFAGFVEKGQVFEI